MKKLVMLLSLVLFFAINLSVGDTVQASSKKIGVYFSELNEDYARLERPAGSITINGVKKQVDRKDRYSSIWDKSLKVYHSLEQEGLRVSEVNEKDLMNQKTLQQYDTIVFPYSVLMTHQQRQVLKQYVRDGGGVVFMYAGARNQAESNLWKTNALDLTPMIYKTESWIWQWDNLSEIFSAGFVSDNHVRNLEVRKASQHPIITNTEKELGRAISLVNTRSNGEWLELLAPYSGYVVPLLQIERATPLDGKGQFVQKGKPLALATEYGHGRVVTIGFKMYDFLEVDAPSANWRDRSQGKAFDGTDGKEDARIFLREATNWTANKVSKQRLLKYDVNLSTNELRAYQGPKKNYVIYGTSHLTNSGDTPVRGTMLIEAIAPNGRVVAKHERYLPGRTPYQVKAGPQFAAENKHSEKFAFGLPGNTPDGNYEIRTTFVEGHRSTPGHKIKAESYILTKKGTGQAKFSNKPNFRDIKTNDSAYLSVRNLANLGVIQGFTPTTFRPDQTVTKKQAVDMILKATGTPIKKNLNLAATDLKKSSPDYDLMATAVQLGLVTVENGKVNAYRSMTRAEVANAIVKGFKLEGIPQEMFADVSSKTKHHNEIHILKQLGVSTGKQATNRFNPESSLTRKNFSAFVDRALKAVQQ